LIQWHVLCEVSHQNMPREAQVKEVRKKVSRTDEWRERSEQRAALEKDVSDFSGRTLLRTCSRCDSWHVLNSLTFPGLNVLVDCVVWHKQVLQLQRQLVIEMNVRNALYRGISRPLGSLPRIYADIPVEVR